MRQLIILLIALFSLNCFAQKSNWMTTPPVDPQTGFPIVNANMIGVPADMYTLITEKLSPINTNHLIGLKIEITADGLSKIQSDQLNESLNSLIELNYFQDANNPMIKLDMNKDGMNIHTPVLTEHKLVREWGYTKDDALFVTVPIDATYIWTVRAPDSAEVDVPTKISIKVSTYNNSLATKAKNIRIISNNKLPLARGLVKFSRLYGQKGSSYDQESRIKNGRPDGAQNMPNLSAGHYKVELLAPSECSGKPIDENFIITPQMLKSDDDLVFTIKCSYAYDMTVEGYVDDDVQYGSKLVYSFKVNDVITHDDTPENNPDYELDHFLHSYDSEGYPIDETGDRLSLPMIDSKRDPRMIMLSWTEKIELIDAHFENHGDGSIDQCELIEEEQNEFGFVRLNEEIRHPITQDVSPVGTYSYLTVELMCHHIEEHGRYDYPASIKISPLVPTIIGGSRIYINNSMDMEAQQDLLESGQDFSQTFGASDKSNKRGGLESPHKVAFTYHGHFTQKEMKRRSVPGDGDGDGSGDDDGGDGPMPDASIFTDPTVMNVDGKDRTLELVIISKVGFLESISYEVHCINTKDKLLTSGTLSNFIPLPGNEQFAYAMNFYDIPKRRRCKKVVVKYDTEHNYEDKEFYPTRDRPFNWDGSVVSE